MRDRVADPASLEEILCLARMERRMSVDDMSGIAAVLGPEVVEQIHRDNNLRLLAGFGGEVAGDPAGWRAEIFGRTIISRDIDVVIRRALAVIRGRRDLWPKLPPSLRARLNAG
jgi:hypothetical protein